MTRSDAPDAAPAARARLPRWAAVAASVTVVLALQAEITHDKLSRPFLDGSLHYDYDNADFTWKARNGIRLGEPRTQLGLTMVPYSAWGVPSGPPDFYTHHPFLMKSLLQLAVRCCGDAEWVSRAFSVGVAMVAAAGFLAALLVATGSVLASFVGAAVLVCTPVFATYQACPKFEIDGMAPGLWLFVALALHLRAPSRARLAAVGLLAAVSALAHWTGLLFAAALFLWLAGERLRRDDPRTTGAAAALLAGGAAGTAAVIGAFVWLQGGWAPFWADIAGVATRRSDASVLPAGAWGAKQLQYVGMNFGPILPWIALALALALAVAWGRRRRARAPAARDPADRLLPALLLGSLFAALVWQLAFRQGSYIHVYWQLWFCLPVATLVAAAVLAAARSPRLRLAAPALGLALAVHLNVLSRDAFAELFRLERGSPDDVAFLRSLRGDAFRRFVFVAVEDDPLNGWFAGPIFEYYTDRGVVVLDERTRVTPADKVLVLAHWQQADLVCDLSRALRVELVRERCGRRFCAYDVVH